MERKDQVFQLQLQAT